MGCGERANGGVVTRQAFLKLGERDGGWEQVISCHNAEEFCCRMVAVVVITQRNAGFWR